jgi:DNA-3-methyladenine glycosylase II
MMSEFRLTPRGPFSLAASARFLEGFSPAAYAGGGAEGQLDLAFAVEGDWRTAGVHLEQLDDGSVRAEVVGDAELNRVRDQVARILCLDVDGSGFPAVGVRDPQVARLQRRYPGLRPVNFWSPYEAAAWALISHRIRIVQAARIKAEMASRLGASVEVRGKALHAFPQPEVLARLEGFPGLFGRKPEWLRALGRAAAEGRLSAARLRSRPPEQALAELAALPGLGPFSAELVLLRGAGEPDWLPRHEPRLLRAVQRAYGLERPPDLQELERLAAAWRPYRTWVCLLLRAELEEETHEIAGAGAPAGRDGRDRGGR